VEVIVEVVHVADFEHDILDTIAWKKLTESKRIEIGILNFVYCCLQEVLFYVVQVSQFKELAILILIIITI
jgi:hypothetical protein